LPRQRERVMRLCQKRGGWMIDGKWSHQGCRRDGHRRAQAMPESARRGHHARIRGRVATARARRRRPVGKSRYGRHSGQCGRGPLFGVDIWRRALLRVHAQGLELQWGKHWQHDVGLFDASQKTRVSLADGRVCRIDRRAASRGRARPRGLDPWMRPWRRCVIHAKGAMEVWHSRRGMARPRRPRGGRQGKRQTRIGPGCDTHVGQRRCAGPGGQTVGRGRDAWWPKLGAVACAPRGSLQVADG
jgi:hypothetical protein